MARLAGLSLISAILDGRQGEPVGARIRASALLAATVAFVCAAAQAQAAPEQIGIAALRPLPGTAAFPVRGQVTYGTGAAAFGADRGGRMHEGQDLFAAAGTPLVAVRDVRVLEAGNGGGRGNYVALYSPAANETYVYMHMLEPASGRPGQRLRAGQGVGRVGCTGSCWGDHLHFEVRSGRGSEAPVRSPLPLLHWLARAPG
jgi:murein DD-endopeptidase MepM/ murein hydrolase activator NlpD